MILYQKDNSLRNQNNDIKIYSDFSFVPHIHRDLELVLVDKGTLEITVENRTFTAKEGQMALILSNKIHSYKSLDKTRVIVHVFSNDNVPNFAKLIAGRDVLTPVFECDERVRSFYIGYCIENEHRTILAVKACLYAVCDDFYKKSDFCTREKEGPDLLHKMLAYISERYRDEISLEKMAQELGYEMHYLSRVFSKNVNINIRRYINLYRIDSAKERLINTEDSITDIALESGFQSIRNFNRVFVSYVGMTPLDYRKTPDN